MGILEYNICYVGKHAEKSVCLLYKVRSDVKWNRTTSWGQRHWVN